MSKLKQHSAQETSGQRLSLGTRRLLRDNVSLWALALPGLILLLVFSYLPMGGIVLAFKDYVPRKGIFGSEWCGFDNFTFFFTSQDAGRTIRNTLLYSVAFLIIDLVLGVVMALLLFHLRSQRSLKAYHTTMLIPRFMSIVIVSFIAYSFLQPSQGFLNRFIQFFGGKSISWYNDPKYWPVILTIVHIWQIAGSGCLYYYAALVGIDSTLFEAASVDGAGTLRKCWSIAIPALLPVICMMLILGIGRLFTADMGLFYNVTKDQGSLYATTDVIATYTYRALLTGALEKSTAVGLFQSAAGMILVLISNAIIRKVSPENSMF